MANGNRICVDQICRHVTRQEHCKLCQTHCCQEHDTGYSADRESWIHGRLKLLGGYPANRQSWSPGRLLGSHWEATVRLLPTGKTRYPGPILKKGSENPIDKLNLGTINSERLLQWPTSKDIRCKHCPEHIFLFVLPGWGPPLNPPVPPPGDRDRSWSW